MRATVYQMQEKYYAAANDLNSNYKGMAVSPSPPVRWKSSDDVLDDQDDMVRSTVSSGGGRYRRRRAASETDTIGDQYASDSEVSSCATAAAIAAATTERNSSRKNSGVSGWFANRSRKNQPWVSTIKKVVENNHSFFWSTFPSYFVFFSGGHRSGEPLAHLDINQKSLE